MIGASSVLIWMLGIMTAIAVVTYFGRLLELRRAQINYEDFLTGVFNVLDAANYDEALAICDDTPAPVANVVAAAIRHRVAPARVLREAVDSRGRAEIGRLDRRLAVLAIMAQVAPLLGLLGTIFGFIRTLTLANSALLVTRAELFDGAMSSLVVAAVGLAVAIVISIMYGSLRVRLDRTVVDLEAAASEIIGYFSTHAAERSVR